jgi:hypothetical protein
MARKKYFVTFNVPHGLIVEADSKDDAELRVRGMRLAEVGPVWNDERKLSYETLDVRALHDGEEEESDD